MKLRTTRHTLALAAPLLTLAITAVAQQGPMPGRSLTWQPAQAPFSPDPNAGAILGGPGNDPNPNAPLYVCRARVQGSLVPGKWVRGSCNVAFAGSEVISTQYDLAYGNARWGAWRGNTYGLLQTGSEADGSPLFSCRALLSGPTGAPLGMQPGKLVAAGTCNIPLGGRELLQSPPFQVLYGFGGGRPPWPNPPYPNPAYPTPAPTPLPGCKATDMDVSHNQSTGSWEGPNCSPSDGFGNINGPVKYAAPPQPSYPDSGYPDAGQPQAAPAPPPYQPGPSSVSWQPVQRPYQPGVGAIPGGPGNGPKPGAPLYICRATINNALLPGKWIDGQCSVSTIDGQEQHLDSYEIASGNAIWKPFDGNIGALVPGGYAPDGTPEFICRKPFSFLGKKGIQPGRLENGLCHIPYAGIDHPSKTPFDALYNNFSTAAAPTH